MEHTTRCQLIQDFSPSSREVVDKAFEYASYTNSDLREVYFPLPLDFHTATTRIIESTPVKTTPEIGVLTRDRMQLVDDLGRSRYLISIKWKGKEVWVDTSTEEIFKLVKVALEDM